MSNLRRLSRSAHPEAWTNLTRFRRLRRLTGQALRAKGRGDLATMERLAALLRRLTGEDVFREDSIRPSEPTLAPPIIQFKKKDKK